MPNFIVAGRRLVRQNLIESICRYAFERSESAMACFLHTFFRHERDRLFCVTGGRSLHYSCAESL
jgi:hypothetical protein